jgi:SAM-dependent methyltransferase
LARLGAGQGFEGETELMLGSQLGEALEAALEVHDNRFSARHHYDLIRPILSHLPRASLRGATVVDVGCGSLNPWAMAFLWLMLGVERAYATDVEPVQNVTRAVKALATCAQWLLIDPSRVLGEDHLSPEEVLRNLRGFDLAKLAAGDPAGVATDRLRYRKESIFDMSLGDGEADLVVSVSFLEHLEWMDDVLESLRRITRVGGHGHHLIDFADHRTYTGEVSSPFEFLKEPGTGTMLYGSNRLRCRDFTALFERHGFAVQSVRTARHVDLTPEEHAQFVEPYRSMPRDELSIVCACVLVRRT